MAKTLVGLQAKSKYFDQIIKIEWFIGLICNFDCSYCSEHARSGFAKKDDILFGINLLDRKRMGRIPNILFAGGEPSIHPAIFEISEAIFNKGFHLGMVSNGSRKPEDYRELLKFMKGITFSVHFEEDYHKTLASIFAVHEAIKNEPEFRDRYIQVNVMMATGFFPEALKVIESLKEKGVPHIIRRIRPLLDANKKPILPRQIQDREARSTIGDQRDQKRDDWGYYTEDEVQKLKSLVFVSTNQNTEELWRDDDGNFIREFANTNDVSLRKLNHFQGWNCNIGVERIHIYNNGDVYRNTCKVGGKLGNIYSDFEMPSAPVVCTKDRCTDAWSINVTKAQDARAANQLRNSMGLQL